MPNVFVTKATKFLPFLDRIYKAKAKTAMLDVPTETLMFINTKTIQLPKIVLDGAADYDRVNGYNKGSLTVDYTPHTIKYDRGRKFGVDILDDDEAAFNVFASLTSEYVRIKQIPEIDAIRFSEMYAQATAGSGTIITADLAANQALPAYDEAELVLNDLEVDEEGRILFCSNTFYKLLKQDSSLVRKFDVREMNVGGVNRKIEFLEDTPIVKVPKGRFYDIIKLNDGVTAGQEAGGFAPIVATSAEINFILADKSALLGIKKAVLNKVFGWQENQFSDENIATYRDHHDLVIPSNKTAGVYVHRKATKVA